MKVTAILSDYDGTLHPTASIYSHNDKSIADASKLEDILFEISKCIPVCIISSKDFYFLYEKVKKFSNIISCILGMETLILDKDKDVKIKDTIFPLDDKDGKELVYNIDNSCSIISRHTLIDPEDLVINSNILNEIANYIQTLYPTINIEKKFLTIEHLLGGITIDWRKNEDWSYDKKKYEKIMKKSLLNVTKMRNQLNMSNNKIEYHIQKLFIQRYSSHPFIDVYSTKTSKGDAYDCIFSEILKQTQTKGKIIYLGDSENDNPAFKKADISIGINSDSRLKPSLKCKYHIEFEDLSFFLKNLKNNNFEFSESLFHYSK
ncbi:MAG TPA: hypothetical protein VIY08_05550 [Candidatus Nitrosocosmicus sp.]